MATTSIGAPGVTFPDATVQATAGGSNVNLMTVGTASGTWTKPASVKSIKVTVVGGGGNSGTTTPALPRVTGGGGGGTAVRFYPAASLPGPQPYTVGGAGATSSFGVAPITVISATGGGVGAAHPGGVPVFGGAGGAGSNGTLNVSGGAAGVFSASGYTGPGGDSLFGQGGAGSNQGQGLVGSVYGGGGGGSSDPGVFTIAGAQGVVIIEEFY